MNIILKLSKLCNLRCTYCYEYDELANKTRMPLDGLEHFFRSLAEVYRDEGWQQPLSFALHGGEPLLLPPEYLVALVELQRKYFGAAGIEYHNAAQTNLYKIPERSLSVLRQLGITLGVSIDVFGDQRVTAAGRNAEGRVRENLVHLLDNPATRPLVAGGITVLHAANVSKAVETFHFFQDLRLDYRILPIFSTTDPPARMAHLMLEPAQVVDALQRVAIEKFRSPGSVDIFPIQDYLSAAIAFLSDRRGNPYDPDSGEWALIIDTNGDVYSHSEVYDQSYCLGNSYRDSFAEILSCEARRKLSVAKKERSRLCDACAFGDHCSRIPVIEALPSERATDAAGHPHCGVAKPMIEFLVDLIRSRPSAMAALNRHASEQEIDAAA